LNFLPFRRVPKSRSVAAAGDEMAG